MEPLGCLSFVLFLGLIVVVIRWSSGKNARSVLESQVELLGQRLDELLLSHGELKRRFAALENRVLAQEHTDAEAEPAPPAPIPVPSLITEPEEAPLPALPEPEVFSAPLAAEAVPPLAPAAEPAAGEDLVPGPDQGLLPAPPPVPPPPMPAPPRVSPPPMAPAEPAQPFDWESLVGVRLFSWIAGLALLVAAISFLRYSIDHGWLGPEVRLAIGVCVGIGLLVACETRRAQAYAVTAHALTAAGVATLFASFFAAHALWHLIGAMTAFGLLALVTAVAVALSIRRDSLFIALLGLLGGFATPALLSTGQDRPIGLFGYLLLLNAGLTWVAYRKRWSLLTAISTVFIALYQLGWVMKFLNESKLGLAAGIFLLFPIFAFGALFLGEKKQQEDLPPLFRQTAAFGAIPPLIFALHLSVTPAYGAHTHLLFGFLFLVVLGLAVVATFQGPEWLHTLGTASVLMVFATWLGQAYTHAAWPGVMGYTALFVVLLLGWPWLQERWARGFWEQGRLGVYGAPLLLFVFPVLALNEPATASVGPFFGVLLLLAGLCALHALRTQEGLVHFIACFFALAAEACWSARYLNPGRLLPALLVYLAFGAYFLGVPLLARAKGRELRPTSGGAILLLASLGLLFFLAAGHVAAFSLWALALMLGTLNLGLLYEASCGRHPFFALAGLALSWVVLAVWWISAPVLGLLLPALCVMGGLAVLAVGGTLVAKAKAESRQEHLPSSFGATGLVLGLAGHVFLLPVVAQPSLALPPWPWLGVLLVLILALGAASLVVKKGGVHLLSMVLGGLLLAVWAGASGRQTPWPTVGLFAGLGLGLLGYLFFEASRRLSLADVTFPRAAGLGLLLGQLALILASSAGSISEPAHGWLILGHAALLSGFLAMAWRGAWAPWSVVGALASGLVLLFWFEDHSVHWERLLALSVPLYLLPLAFPLLLGPRTREERMPFLAAIVASVVFFFAAWKGLLAGGFKDFIGALPVLQGFLLVPHLRALLRLQPEGERDQGRLALVAGAILALVTVAIPLQLDKEWITLGWALQGVALAWLYGRIPHKGLLAWTACLMALVFARLCLNPAVLAYHPRSATPIFNWYLYTYLVSALAFFASARLLAVTDYQLFQLPRLSSILPALGAVLLFLLLNIEIADFHSVGPALTLNITGGSLAQDLSYTIGWAVYGIGLLGAGIWFRNRATRIASIALIAVTILKAFLHDLGRLSGLYRVASFVGLAICLAFMAVLLQKFVLRKTPEES